jgi:poly(3-hydroxyalkanoate) synthetase
VWNYWVNNYLLGKRPPAFDILFWNSDTTRMTAALHADFVDLALENSLTRPGALTVLGAPVDLGEVTVDSYLVAGIADHITPGELLPQRPALRRHDRFALSPAVTSPPWSARQATPRRPTTPTTT